MAVEPAADESVGALRLLLRDAAVATSGDRYARGRLAEGTPYPGYLTELTRSPLAGD